MTAMAWQHIADTADLTGKDVIGREVDGRPVAIYRVKGEYHATAGFCTHANALLCEGEVVDGFIECPAHYGYFEIATGRAQGSPVTVDLRTYPVRVVGSRIEVDVDRSG